MSERNNRTNERIYSNSVLFYAFEFEVFSFFSILFLWSGVLCMWMCSYVFEAGYRQISRVLGLILYGHSSFSCCACVCVLFLALALSSPCMCACVSLFFLHLIRWLFFHVLNSRRRWKMNKIFSTLKYRVTEMPIIHTYVCMYAHVLLLRLNWILLFRLLVCVVVDYYIFFLVVFLLFSLSQRFYFFFCSLL